MMGLLVPGASTHRCKMARRTAAARRRRRGWLQLMWGALPFWVQLYNQCPEPQHSITRRSGRRWRQQSELPTKSKCMPHVHGPTSKPAGLRLDASSLQVCRYNGMHGRARPSRPSTLKNCLPTCMLWPMWLMEGLLRRSTAEEALHIPPPPPGLPPALRSGTRQTPPRAGATCGHACAPRALPLVSAHWLWRAAACDTTVRAHRADTNSCCRRRLPARRRHHHVAALTASLCLMRRRRCANPL
jgi:hypothetical protein